MNNQIKSVLIVLGIILLSNWGAGIIVKNKEVTKIAKYTGIRKVQNKNAYLCDSSYFKKNTALEKKR